METLIVSMPEELCFKVLFTFGRIIKACGRGGGLADSGLADDVAAGGNRDVICRQGRSGRPLEFRDGFVEIGLSLKLAAAGLKQFDLPKLHNNECRRARAKEPLLAFKKLLSRCARSQS